MGTEPGPCEESTYKEMFIHLLGEVKSALAGGPRKKGHDVRRELLATIAMLEKWHRGRVCADQRNASFRVISGGACPAPTRNVIPFPGGPRT
jgi:hypothetical protein